MRTQLKSTLALVLALLICVSVFAACKGNKPADDPSSTPVISFAEVPSQAVIDTETGEIKMAYGSTFADLKEDLQEEGQLAEGETLQLFQADQVTEITDEATLLESGMIVIKKDADGNELLKLTLVIEAAVVSQEVNSEGQIVVTLETGEQVVYEVNSETGEQSIVSTIPATPSNGGASTDPTTSVATPSNTPDTPSNVTSVELPSAGSVVSIDSGAAESVINDKYTLTVAGDRSDNSLVMAIMAFQKKHSNVTIRITAAGDGGRITSLDNLKMQLASNNAPDVVQMDSVYVAAAGYQGYVLELQQFGSDDVKDLFIESCWQSVQSQIAGEETQFGLPFDCNTILMFYNKTLLDKAGVSTIPSTWSEFTTSLEKLKTLSEVSSPFNLMVNFDASLGQKNYMAFQWMMYLWRLGGEVLNSDLTAAAFAEQPGIDALQMYVDMVGKYGVSNQAFTDAPFLNGTAGFNMMTNNHYSSTVGSSTTNVEFGATMLPELKAGVPRYSGLGLYSVALPNKITGAGNDANKVAKATAQAQWAYEFAEFWAATLDYQMAFCENTLLMPSLKAGEGQGPFTGEYWTIAYQQLRTSKFRPGVKNWDSIETYLSEAINAAVNGNKTPQEALKAAAVLANRQLA